MASLTFILPNPEAAARASGEAFQVTVVREELPEGTTNFATAATLTFLREALGCPMTTASSLYARALGGEEGVSWAGAKLRFVEESLGDHSVHGLRVAL